MNSQFKDFLEARKTVQVGGCGQESPEMIASRRRTLIAWVNKKVEGVELKIENLTSDLENGIVLIKLLECLAPGKKMPGRYYTRPVNKIQKVQNLAIAFEFITDVERITICTNIQPTYILEQKEDAGITLIWLLILHYEIGYKMATGESLDKAILVLKRTLLTWINGILPGQNITNFNTDWKDGCLLSALVDYYQPGLIPDHASLKAAQSAQNAENAFTLAETQLKVTALMSAEELALEKPDEISLMVYLAQFCASGSHGQQGLLDWIQQESAKDNKDTLLAIPAAADKVDVSDIQIPNEPGEGKSIWIELDCSDAGYGEVRAEVKGKSSGNVLAAVKEVGGHDQIGTGKYRVSFEPPSVDVYNFSVFYGNGHVTGSPFSVNLYPSDHEKVVHTGTTENSETGQDVALNFETKDAGRGKLTAKAEGELSGSVPVKISPLGNGTFAVSFHHQFQDIYTVDVFWSKFSAQAVGKQTGPIALQVNQDKSEYLVSFKATNPDVYTVNMNWDGKPVPGSPFIINLLPPPMPEKVECAVPIYNEPRKLAKLFVDTSNAGSGKLKAHCTGEQVGDVPVKLTKVAGRTYQCAFTPPEKDLYTLDVLFDNKHVKGSPFKIDMRPGTVSDASKCVLLNPPRSGMIILIGQPITFAVDCTQAGPGELNVNIDGLEVRENLPNISVKPRPEDKNIFDVTFIPKTQGPHDINLTWFNDPIPNIPIRVNAVDPDNIVNKSYGETVEVVCEAWDLKAVAIHNETGTRYKVKTNKIQKKSKYELSFSPQHPGLYRVHVTVKDKEIPESPIVVNYSKPPKPNAVRVNGLNSKCYVDEPMTFTVDTTDAGSGNLTVRSQGPKQKDKSELPVTDNKNGIHTIDYTPHKISDHVFTITGKAVPGSPFHSTAREHTPELDCSVTIELFIYDTDGMERFPVEAGPTDQPDAGKCVILGLETLPEKFQTNQPISFQVGTRFAGNGKLSLTAEGVQDKPKLVAKASKKYSRIFDVTCVPTAPGTHNINVLWSGEPVPKSPLSFPVEAVRQSPYDSLIHKEQPKPEACIVKDLPKQWFIHKQGTFLVDATKAGSADLHVKVSSPSKGKEGELKVNNNEDRTYTVEYTPEVLGEHKFNLTWAGKTIPDSPVVIKISDENETKAQKVYTLFEGFQPFIANPIPLGTTVDIDINTADAGYGTLKVKQSGGDGKANIDLTEKDNSVYACTLTPTERGHCQLNILWNDKDIRGSPFNLTFIPVTGINLDGENFRMGTENKFTVDRKSVMEGQLKIYCSEVQAADVTIQPADDGMEFYCIITVKKEGDYQIIAKYNGYHIVGSPFNVHFQKPAPTNMSFSLNAEGAETSDVSATVINSLTLEQLQVNLTHDLHGDLYSLEGFIPTDGLEYLVTINCKVKVKTVEKVVTGSPFVLKYEKQPVDASKCQAEGEVLALTGSGQLNVAIAGNAFGDKEVVITAAVPGTVTPLEDDSFRCNVGIQPVIQTSKYPVEDTHKAAPRLPDVQVSQSAKPENEKASGPGLEDSLTESITEEAGTQTAYAFINLPCVEIPTKQ